MTLLLMTRLDPGRRHIIRTKPINTRPASAVKLTGGLTESISDYDPSRDAPAHSVAFWKHLISDSPPDVLADDDHGTRDDELIQEAVRDDGAGRFIGAGDPRC